MEGERAGGGQHGGGGGPFAGGGPLGPFLARQGFVVLDGGLATELEARGHRLDSRLWSARLLLDAPDSIRDVHEAYLAAGADCIATATYQASFPGLSALGVTHGEAVELLVRATSLAVEARDAFWAARTGGTEGADRLRPLVAASVGPYGAYLADGSEYHGRYGVDRAALTDFHRERLSVLAASGADLVAFETIPSTVEAEVLLELLDQTPGTWAWLSVSCRDGASLSDGSPVESVAQACAGVERVAGVGVNCTAPAYVAELVGRLTAVTRLPVVAYANSGESYDARTKSWSGTPAGDGWLEQALGWYAAGARVLGGCCRVGPDLVRALRSRLEEATGAAGAPA